LLRDRIGLDNVCWELDYPHADSAWPRAPEELGVVLADAPPVDVAKITHENAMRWYSFDPFTGRTREDSTVAALRAASPEHAVSIRSLDGGRHARSTGIEIAALQEQATA